MRRVHLALIRMVRAGPEPAPWDVVVDSCSVRAKRGGDLVGPNPTDRGKLYADAGYDSAENRDLCRHDGIQPHIRKIDAAHASGPGRIRSVVEHDCAWLLANKRLDRRHDRLGHITTALLAAACIFIAANRIDAF